MRTYIFLDNYIHTFKMDKIFLLNKTAQLISLTSILKPNIIHQK